MSKLQIITKILYLLSATSYITFLCARNNMFMFLGGLLLIAASIMLIYINKKH